MRQILIVVLAVCLFSLPVGLIAQSERDSIKVNLESFTIKDGLSQGFVSCIIQDKEGYMWFATKDGLNKYDGYHVVVYRNNPKDSLSLPDNFVTQMIEDSNGNFWLGTNTKGLCLFDKKKEQFYTISAYWNSDSLINDAIIAMEYRDGKLLVVKNSNIFLLDVSKILINNFSPGNLKNVQVLFDYNAVQKATLKPFIKPYVADLLSNNLILISSSNAISSYTLTKNGNWNLKNWPPSHYGLANNLPFRVFAVPSKNEALIFNTKSAVLYDFTNNKILYKFNFETEGNYTNRITENIDGSIWLGTTKTLYCFNTNTFQLKKLLTLPKLNDNLIFGYKNCIDRNNTLWVGTNGFGIFKYNNNQEQFHSIPLTGICTYLENEKQEICISIKNGFSFFNPHSGVLRKCYLPQLKTADFPAQLLIDKKGVYWFLSRNIKNNIVTLNSFNPYTNAFKKFGNKPLKFKNIYKLFLDNEDTLWALKHNADNTRSIVIIDKQSGQILKEYFFPVKNDFNNYNFISSWRQDKQGVFWFGTLQGLFSFNELKNEWHQWKNNAKDDSSLSADMIFSICADSKQPYNYLWIGTNGGGLNRFEYATGKCIHYTDKDGLPNNVIYGILSDAKGNLWMSTNKGLSCGPLTPKVGANDNTPFGGRGAGLFRNFTDADGLQGLEFNRYEYLKLQSGELVFGGVNGMNVFNPAEVFKQSPAPNIVFTSLSVYNKPVNFKTDSSIINTTIGYAKTITLPYAENMFTIEFAALASAPANNKSYRYFLEGFDKKWIENGIKNTATFTNLDAGDYTLYVTGCVNNGQWNEKGISIKIIIVPPWWQTWWFRCLVSLAVSLAVYALYQYRLRQLLKLQALRNSIARDLHDEIGSTLSSISLYGESAKMMVDANHPLNNVLTKINNSTNNMMESMSDIVWAINTRNDQFDNLINRMNALANEVVESKGCNVYFDSNNASKKLELNMEERKNLYLLYKEIINNTAKHSACKNLWVTILLSKNQFMLKVKDDGVGFVPQSLHEGFGGNGLINIKKRAADLKASLSIHSVPGQGTTIELLMNL